MQVMIGQGEVGQAVSGGAVSPTRPTVSVLMTTWNGAGFIGASIASVLAQSFTDFELIVVDDGSTDATAEVLAGIGDRRLRVLRQAVNGGVVAARNAGFAAVRGRYVAALDHDDLSHPERLARQVAYLDAHPGVVLLATEIEIEARGRRSRFSPLPLREGMGGGVATAPASGAIPAGRRHAPDHPTGGDPALIRWLLHVDNPLTWSSVMFRADAVRRLGVFMRPEYELADDFDLYHRLLTVGDIARLSEVLTVYRWHARNTTHGREDALNAAAVKVLAAAYAKLLGGAAEDAAMLVIRHLSDRQPVRDGATLAWLGLYLSRLLAAFCAVHELGARQRTALESVTGTIWWRIVRAAMRSGAPGLLRRYRAQPALAAAFQPRHVDVVISTLVGIARAAMYRLRA
jgi:glycosyltransferase involved in cell wall biosynthesis